MVYALPMALQRHLDDHTTLFAAALAALGFEVQARSARVRLGAKKVTGLSHAVVWA